MDTFINQQCPKSMEDIIKAIENATREGEKWVIFVLNSYYKEFLKLAEKMLWQVTIKYSPQISQLRWMNIYKWNINYIFIKSVSLFENNQVNKVYILQKWELIVLDEKFLDFYKRENGRIKNWDWR